MRAQDVVIGESYRLKENPHYSWLKVVEILKPKEGVNPHPYIVVKCEHTVRKNDKVGIIYYIRPRDIVRGKKLEEGE